MIKKFTIMFPALMLGLMMASCERIDPQVVPAGEPIDFSATMDDIPLQYGRLVSVTSDAPFLDILWFEQADQTIVGVRVNVSRGTVSKEVIRIERE